MNRLSVAQIKEIAEQIDCGHRCYYNKVTGTLLSIPGFEDDLDLEDNFFEKELEELEKDRENFITIEQPSSRESFQIMEDFIEHIDNRSLQVKLINALEKRKPFREFKWVIDNSGLYREKWFEFKNEQLMNYVRENLSLELGDNY